MTNLLRSKSIDTDVLLRALAICLIALNHAIPQGTRSYGIPGVAGGMTLLLMMSGFSFARFVLEDATPADIRKGLFSFGMRIFVPSLIAVIFFMAIKQRVSIAELLFVRNWIDPHRIAIFPVWYVQVIVQIVLLLLVFFAVAPLANWFVRDPLRGALVLWLVALATRMILPIFVDTKPLLHHLPHLYLWNFTLGWIVFFLHARGTAGMKALASVAIVGSAVLVWGLDSWQFLTLAIGGTALVWKDRVTLPAVVARPVSLISQATFTIFLVHRFVYVVYLQTLAHVLPAGLLMWVVGVVVSTGAWVLGSAAIRAYRKLSAKIDGNGAERYAHSVV